MEAVSLAAVAFVLVSTSTTSNLITNVSVVPYPNEKSCMEAKAIGDMVNEKENGRTKFSCYPLTGQIGEQYKDPDGYKRFLELKKKFEN